MHEYVSKFPWGWPSNVKLTWSKVARRLMRGIASLLVSHFLLRTLVGWTKLRLTTGWDESILKANCQMKFYLLSQKTHAHFVIVLVPLTQIAPHLPSLEQQKTQQEQSTSALSPPRQSDRMTIPAISQRGFMFPVKSLFSMERYDKLVHSLDRNEGTVPVNRFELSDRRLMSEIVWRPVGMEPPMLLKDRSKTCMFEM